jgi:cytochrome c biogenesis protein CcmG/thiol:disulfide interchange protein DsbE
VRRVLPFIPVVVLVALGLLFWAHSLKKQDVQVQPNALIGKPLPTAAFPPLDGGTAIPVTPALGGKPGLVNVFGSWCGPCFIEAPQLMALKQAGVNIVGVTWMDQPGNTHAFLERTGNPFSLVLQGGDQASVEFGITAAPETFIVNSKGMVVDKRTQPLTDADVKAILKQLKTLG